MSRWFSYDTDKMLACSCGCNTKGMEPSFLELLDHIRDEVGPMTVTSGYRCAAHNMAVSSTGASGPHTFGRAIDIKANSDQRYRILAAGMNQGINRFGIAKSFIHLDSLNKLDGFPEDRIWTYS
jgi:uncharacterized protein YcbK (DUF882 family)